MGRTLIPVDLHLVQNDLATGLRQSLHTPVATRGTARREKLNSARDSLNTATQSLRNVRGLSVGHPDGYLKSTGVSLSDGDRNNGNQDQRENPNRRRVTTARRNTDDQNGKNEKPGNFSSISPVVLAKRWHAAVARRIVVASRRTPPVGKYEAQCDSDRERPSSTYQTPGP